MTSKKIAMKKILKKILPVQLLEFYHFFLAKVACLVYKSPSDKLLVIGVTGTNGKTTVVNFIASIFEADGKKVALTSTANFKIADKEWLNDKKMTMMGPLYLQKFLRQAVKQNCKVAIIETSSEGVKQFRHLGLNYDAVVFTNLTPEHLDSHGGFIPYRNAKGKLFQHLLTSKKKILNGKEQPKISVINNDSNEAEYFLNFKPDQQITFSLDKPSDFQATSVQLNPTFSTFNAGNKSWQINLPGVVNVYNALSAIAITTALGIEAETINNALKNYAGTPGRFEFIKTNPASAEAAAGKQDFQVLVDYAPEPESLKQLYETLELFPYQRLIHILGSCGGGRDKSRQPILGEMAGTKADIVIVTNEDPYDDDPQEIIDNVASGAIKAGKILNQNLFKILDRKQAIEKALNLAEKDDLVLLTGKGSEQFICVANGKKIPWDDREMVREILKSL